MEAPSGGSNLATAGDLGAEVGGKLPMRVDGSSGLRTRIESLPRAGGNCSNAVIAGQVP